MRAFRPSYLAPYEVSDEDRDEAKQAHLTVYAARAAVGLPLFENLSQAEQFDQVLPRRIAASGS
jgi:hypothetical protein